MNELEVRLNRHDWIDQAKLFRVYRDVRFSGDKTPYKAHFAMWFSRQGEDRRGGYYLRIKPGETFLGAGFWRPDKADLLRIRKEWEMDASPLRSLLANPNFSRYWGELKGEQLKRAPKGFSPEHPDIDLIKFKQYLFTREFTDQEVLDEHWIETADQHFKEIRPFLDLMSDVLTTNLNGESLL